MSEFDPAALQILGVSFDEESILIEEDLKHIADEAARRQCAALKLASRIIGIATANSAELDDAGVLRSMSEFMTRLSTLRHVALSVIGADKNSTEFPAVFNAVTNAMLDVVTEEWKWGQLAPGESRKLPPNLIANLIDMTVAAQPYRFDKNTVGIETALARRLCLMEAIPRLHGLVNLFDYYQKTPDVMVERLMRSVVENAEFHAELLVKASAPLLEEGVILSRVYGISTSLMCEVYKAAAYRDVMHLRSMPDLDRSIVIAQYEHLGGMKYDHILDDHQVAMERSIDTANLILESRQKS